MYVHKEIINIDDWVEIVRESKTQGLVGGHFSVVSTSPSGVEVMVMGNREYFNYDDVRKMTFKEKWGIDKLPTLYHGTDLRFASLPEETRKGYCIFCHSIINGLRDVCRPFFAPGNDRVELLNEDIKNQYPDLSDKVHKALSNLMMMGRSEDFQYGDFYVSSQKWEAIMYAFDAYVGGELGFNTYYLAKGLQMAGVVNLFEMEQLRDYFKTMTKMVEEEHKPAIFSFDNLSPLYLRTEQNESIQRYIVDGKLKASSFRYLKPIKLDISTAELLKKDLKSSLNDLSKIKD